MTTETWKALRAYLDRLGLAEYRSQKQRTKRGKFRYSPSAYHRQLVALLGKDDENGFKALKLTEGPYSDLGV